MTNLQAKYPDLPRLVEFGWDEGFAGCASMAAVGSSPGRVVAQHRGIYRVAGPMADLSAVLGGRFRYDNPDRIGHPVVGDWVLCGEAGAGGRALIVDVLPRRSTIERKRPGRGQDAQVIAANVDIVLIAVALTEPLNPRRLERYVALAWESGAHPVVVLTKADLCDDPAGAVAAAMGASAGAEVVAISSTSGMGLDRLIPYLRPGRTAVILGQSGVGKSTLTNTLLGEGRMDTRTVRRDGKGRHTTSHRELFRLPSGSLLIDTPGLREVGLWDAAEGIRTAFTEIDELAQQCRFADCRHDSEPGCAVLAAAQSGDLDPERLAGWRRLERERIHLERRGNRAAEAVVKAHAKAVERAFRRHLRSK